MSDVNGNAEAFAQTAKTIATTSEFNLVLMTEKPAVMKAALEAAGFKRPLMYAATAANVAEMGALAKEKRSAPRGQGRIGRRSRPAHRRS